MQEIRYFCDLCNSVITGIDHLDHPLNIQIPRENGGDSWIDTEYDTCTDCLKSVHEWIKSRIDASKIKVE